MSTGRSWSGFDLDEARNLYDSGLSFQQVAKRLGCTKSMVARRFRSAGIPVRPSGRPLTTPSPAVDPAEIVRRRKAGESFRPSPMLSASALTWHETGTSSPSAGRDVSLDLVTAADADAVAVRRIAESLLFGHDPYDAALLGSHSLAPAAKDEVDVQADDGLSFLKRLYGVDRLLVLSYRRLVPCG